MIANSKGFKDFRIKDLKLAVYGRKEIEIAEQGKQTPHNSCTCMCTYVLKGEGRRERVRPTNTHAHVPDMQYSLELNLIPDRLAVGNALDVSSVAFNSKPQTT